MRAVASEYMRPPSPDAMNVRRAAGGSGRVLLTEGEHRGAVAACRSLARAGYEVVVVAGRRPAPAHWSRACHVALPIAHPGDRPDDFLAELESLVAKGGFDGLIVGGERSLLPISEQRERFERYVELGLPEHAAVLRSLDKFVLLDAASAAGLDAPQTRVCTSLSEARDAVAALGFPIVVKAQRSVLPSSHELRQLPVWVASRGADLDEILAAVQLPALVQRFEARASHLSTAGLMTTEGMVGFVVVRFLRTWPPLAGAACFAETVPTPPDLPQRVETLLDALGWRGIFELELLDLGEGRLAAIDLNPRLFGWLALAVAAGADLPRLWMEGLAGRKPKHVEPLAGVRYRWEEADFAHLLWQLKRARLREAAEVAVPRARVAHAHFRARDPGPLFARALDLARRRSTFR
jgi:predicted ATP-grasp superfamily ATP-dependent carboligase